MYYKSMGFILAASVLLIPTTTSANDLHQLLNGNRDIEQGGRPDGPRRAVIRQPASLPQCQQGPMIIPPCPGGTKLVIFDAPVYDENGLFVVCLEKVPFCIPKELEPEG